jgi:UDP-glucose 4-epimerase
VIGIIGGTGFIGLNLLSHLWREGRACRTFSRNGLLLSPESIYYPELSKVEHVQGDFADNKAVSEFVASCRTIVVLVSHLLPASSEEEIRTVLAWFGPAFVQLFENCRRTAVEQIVFVSSGGTIYGDIFPCRPVNEDHPLNPHSAYGSFCAFLEQLIRTFHNQHALPYTILRVGNPYGLLKRPNKNQGLIDHYIRCARADRPFTIFGDGSETRDYIYIDDISAAMARVLEVPAKNEIFNVGTGAGHTSLEVINMIATRFNLPDVPLVFADRRPGDVHCSLLDMTKFESAYGMRCRTSLEEGLNKYAALELGRPVTRDRAARVEN